MVWGVSTDPNYRSIKIIDDPNARATAYDGIVMARVITTTRDVMAIYY